MSDPSKKEIDDLITSLRENWKDAAKQKQKILSQNIDRVKQAWKPLTDHLEDLAEMKLPEGKSFSYDFEQRDSGALRFYIYFHETDTTRDYRQEVDFLSKSQGVLLLCTDIKNATLMASLFNTLHLEKTLYPNNPKDITSLKDALTAWFVNVVGHDFDEDKVGPSVVHRTTINKPEL